MIVINNFSELVENLTVMLEKSIDKGYKDGLERAINIIDEELEFAKSVNPQMAMGMNQVKLRIHQEINK